jgi:hypothetical protein
MGQQAGTATAVGTTLGVLGGRWRADIDGRGRIVTWEGAALDWWVAAEDRWHDPRVELTVRQQRVEGTPVVETRLRVPGGDVIHRAYAVADAGGVTVIEIENDSPASIAVVFSHGRLLTARPPADVPIEGIEVPSDAVSFPVGHHASLRVGISHAGTVGVLLVDLPSPLAVARGWTRRAEAASRVVLPDAALAERLVGSRCVLMLDGPADAKHDAAAALVGLGELVRMGADAVDLVPDVVTVAERLAKSARSCGLDWAGNTGLLAAQRLLASADEQRAADDVGALCKRLGGDGAPAPVSAPDNILFVPWLEQRLARPTGGGRCVLLAEGHPSAWLGANWEVHQLPAGPRSSVSYALRWHGERPAVLWEVSGEPVVLVGGAAAADWTSDARSGEDLWPQP